MTTTTATTTSEAAVEFRARLTAWYREHGRYDLPWRLTRDPYAVLVSEVMLQQTQVDRVLPYYHAWLERWPTVAALAEASPAEVIRAWRGLGYNRRGLNLHRLAVAVVIDHKGRIPADAKALRALPGIGPYTEAAVRCFASGEAVPVADTNIARVVARTALGAASQREPRPRDLAAALDALVPDDCARDHNLALMDLGALICTARDPRCGECPVAGSCRWYAAGRPPGQRIAKPLPRFEETARFARGRILDALREAPATERELAAVLPAPHAAKLAAYLTALERDGLVVSESGAWSLPA